MFSIKRTLNTLQFSLVAISLITLSGCATADKIANIGKAPAMSQIANPMADPQYQPVSLPMPKPQHIKPEKNSLWQSDRITFFKDQRANDIGDIITVLIDIEDEATLENDTEHSRTLDESASLGSLLGLEQSLNRILPEAVNNDSLANIDSNSNHSGSGSIEREDEIRLRMAALVTQMLPNGNMVIHGKQELLVNFEKRLLQIDGVIRPEDISTDNTISYDQIAEARIVYGGEGQLMNVQQTRYGQQLYDIIFPF